MRRSHTGHAAVAVSAVAILLGGQVAFGQPGPSSDAMRDWLEGHAAAFNAKDLERLSTFYHPEVTIFEGGGIDRGWAAYRDDHLGPELGAFENLQFGRTNVQVQLLGDRVAYVTAEYTLKAKMNDRPIDSDGLETLVLVRADDGSWRIRHSHTSSRRRSPP